jgi:UDP-2,3-diacylglucosamine pyrophosphatase LpxH
MTTTRIISDLHIEDGKGAFTTSGGPAALNGFLDMAGDDPLILDGDTFELWANLWNEIINGPNWPIVERFMNHPNVTVILGNHDAKLGMMQILFGKNRVKTSLQIGDWIVTHGHQFDGLLNSAWKRWMAEEADRLAEELANPAVDSIKNWFQASDNASSEKDIMDAVRDTGKSWIFGHTHRSKVRKLSGGGLYVNLGCWCATPEERCYAEIDDGAVTLNHWQG